MVVEYQTDKDDVTHTLGAFQIGKTKCSPGDATKYKHK